MPSAASGITKTSCKENAPLKGGSACWLTISEIPRGKAAGTHSLNVQISCSSVLRRGDFYKDLGHRWWKYRNVSIENGFPGSNQI